MTTLTIKIDERSKKGKAFLEFAKTFFADEKEVEIIESDSKKKLEKTIYSKQFTKKILSIRSPIPAPLPQIKLGD